MKDVFKRFWWVGLILIITILAIILLNTDYMQKYRAGLIDIHGDLTPLGQQFNSFEIGVQKDIQTIKDSEAVFDKLERMKTQQ